MTGNYQVVYSPAAINDLKDIYSYIAFERKANRTAVNQVNRIRKEIRSLNTMPERYSIVDWEPWRSMKMHKAAVNNYVVFYLVNSEDKMVTVVRIFYGGRDIEEIVNSETAPIDAPL